MRLCSYVLLSVQECVLVITPKYVSLHLSVPFDSMGVSMNLVETAHDLKEMRP